MKFSDMGGGSVIKGAILLDLTREINALCGMEYGHWVYDVAIISPLTILMFTAVFSRWEGVHKVRNGDV